MTKIEWQKKFNPFPFQIPYMASFRLGLFRRKRNHENLVCVEHDMTGT